MTVAFLGLLCQAQADGVCGGAEFWTGRALQLIRDSERRFLTAGLGAVRAWRELLRWQLRFERETPLAF